MGGTKKYNTDEERKAAAAERRRIAMEKETLVERTERRKLQAYKKRAKLHSEPPEKQAERRLRRKEEDERRRAKKLNETPEQRTEKLKQQADRECARKEMKTSEQQTESRSRDRQATLQKVIVLDSHDTRPSDDNTDANASRNSPISNSAQPLTAPIIWKLSFPTRDGKPEETLRCDSLEIMEEELQSRLKRLETSMKWTCRACFLMCPTNIEYALHIKECPSICKICGDIFTNLKDLAEHHRWHASGN